MMSRKTVWTLIGGAGALLLVLPAMAAAQGRFHGLDRNRDGVISRAEWRGNDTSFRQHDRNRDGVIAGAEVGHVPAWDARNNRWENSSGASGKAKAHADHGKAKPAKPAKAKPKGRGKGKG
jgi:hypothetical protein